MRRLILAAALTLASPHLAPAQEPPAGTRVRVTATDPALKRTILVVQSVRNDTLRARLGSDTITVPLAAATRVEVSQGRHRHRWRWAAIGTLAGGIAALATVELLAAEHPDYEDPTVIFGAMIVAPALIAGGTVTGAVAAPLREDWKTVVLGSPTSLGRGTRVRVWASDPALSGAVMTVDAVRGGFYLLSRGGATVEVPAASITRMEVWIGTAGRTVTTLRGAGIGAVAGGAYGLVAARASSTSDPASVIAFRTAAAGAVLGGLWGAARPGGHWRSAPNARLAVARADDGGTRLGIAVRF